MTTEPSDDQFAQHVLLSHIVSSRQLEAAQEEQAQLSASGETIALSDVLVKQGALTEAVREKVEQSMNLTQPKPNKQSVGPFNLLKKLGEGGMGTVFLADDTLVKRKVALKVLPIRYASNADFLSRFKREAKSAGQLNHPNIVAAYTTGEDLGLHYYVMEYCDGEPLDRILKSMKRLPWDTAVNYTLQIARGLKHAHEKHIVHRDIKPGNIFITSEGVAKILDMGLSKNIRDSEQSFNTVSGTALGTPHYISPEQAKGEREVDGRTDIYSLGATLYHLVTGATPFQGSTPAMVMMKHLNDKLPNPQDLCEEVPDGIVQVIQKMMAKEPDDRYGNCSALIDDLELVAQGRLPVNADVAEDKTSVGMRAVRRTGVDPARKPKAAAAGVRSPIARIKAAPVSQRPAAIPRRFSSTMLAAIGGTIGVIALLYFVIFSGKKIEKEAARAVKLATPAARPAPTPTVAVHKEPVPAQTAKIAQTVPATTPAATTTHAVVVAVPPPVPLADVKGTLTKSGNAILFEEDFKKLSLEKLPVGLTAVLKDKLSIVSVSGHGNVLRVATTPADGNVEPGLKLTLDAQKMRGRTVLATVQAYAPYGFKPTGDAAFNRPALESILEGRTAKKADNADFLQPDEREWRQLVRIVKVPEDAQSLQFFVKTLDIEGEIFFDDFKVTIIPDDSISGAPSPRTPFNPDEVAGRDPALHHRRPNPGELKSDLSPLPDPRPYANLYVALDISSVCNADVISTAAHSAEDSFKADIVSNWTTASWLKANPKKDAKDLGLPDNGYIRIPKTIGPSGFFQFILPPAKNAIMLTPAKGRFPNPVTLLLSANQRERYSQLAFLHGGSWGDGRLRALLHYSTGKDQIDWLKIEDWHPLYRLPLSAHETVAVATINTHDKPAEMCAQSMLLDGTRVLESITFTFDPVNAPAAEEVPHDDRFTAGIFAISALPAPKQPDTQTPPKPPAPAVKAAPVAPKQPAILPKPVIDTAPKPSIGPASKEQILPAEKHPASKRP